MPFLFTLICFGCGKSDTPKPIEGKVVAPFENVTSISLSSDSAHLWVATSDTFFFSYELFHKTIRRYYLPDELRGKCLYCIIDITDSTFLIAPRNGALRYVSYPKGESEGKYPRISVQLALPHLSYPDKGCRISVYNMLRCGDTIFAGSSNGLAYIPLQAFDSVGISRSDTIYMRPVAAMEHLRRCHTQFSQEGMLNEDGRLLLATDRGIFSVDKSETDIPMAVRSVAPGRYWSISRIGNKAYALRTDSSGGREIVTIDIQNGKTIKTCPTAPSTSRIVAFNDSILPLGPDSRVAPAEYGLPCSALSCSGDLYYIRNGQLACVAKDNVSEQCGERIAYDLGSFVISDGAGIWEKKRTGDKYGFVGELSGLPRLKGAAYSPQKRKIFLVTDGGIYQCRTRKFLFPSDIESESFLSADSGDADRIESIAACDDGLLVGTRNGLKYIDFDGHVRRNYRFMLDKESGLSLDSIYESAYVTDIMDDPHGGYFVETLNFGMWRLASIDSTDLLPAGIPVLEMHAESDDIILPSRPVLTWELIGRKTGWIMTGLCVVFTVLFVIFVVIRKLHRSLRLRDQEAHKRELAKMEEQHEQSINEIRRLDQEIYSQELERLEKEHTRSKDESRRVVVASYAEKLTRLDKALASASNKGEDRLARKLRLCRRLIVDLMDNPDNVAKREKADHIWNKIEVFCQKDIFDPIEALCKTFPNPKKKRKGADSEIYRLMENLKDSVEEIKPFPKVSSESFLECAARVYAAFICFRNDLMEILEHLKSEKHINEPYTPQYIERLWSAVLALDTEHVLSDTQYPLFKDKAVFKKNRIRNTTNGEEEEDGPALNIGKTIFCSLVFHSIAKPDVEGMRSIGKRGRSFYEFRPERIDGYDTDNHGSVYKMIAESMTPDILDRIREYSRFPVIPARIADMIWVYYFRRCREPISGLRITPELEKSLRSAIYGAYRLKNPRSTFLERDI